jgi:hypothetical protein
VVAGGYAVANRVVWLTLAACAVFVVAQGCLFYAALGRSAAPMLSYWAATPYVGYCALAVLMRRSGSVSTSVLIATLGGGAVLFAAYCISLQSSIGTRSGVDVLEGVELLLPVFHWVFVVWLMVVVGVAKALYDRAARATDGGLPTEAASRLGAATRSEGIIPDYRRLSA